MVGRPNVGKSTLVNRVVGARSAVVDELAGATRDRRELEADWAGRDFIVVDTGGWEAGPDGDLSRAVREQAEGAVSGADVVVLVVDGLTELTDDDLGVVSILRSAGAPVVLAANKLDNAAAERAADRLWGLGLGEPHAVSAYHGRGVGDLLDAVVEALPERGEAPKTDAPRLAVVGRPNVGKSTLLNRLVGEPRVIVSETAGTTRDPIEATAVIDGEEYRVVDTAGIRRKAGVDEGADYYSVLRAREALAGADAALLMVDACEGIVRQDQKIAAEIVDAGVSAVVLLNKWDAVDEERMGLVERSLPDRFGFLSWAPVLRISAETGARVGELGPVVEAVLEARERRVSTGRLNRDIRRWARAHPPPVKSGRRPTIQYAVQAGTSPPTFVLFTSGGELADGYLRFLENRLRESHDFVGAPFRFVARARPKR